MGNQAQQTKISSSLLLTNLIGDIEFFLNIQSTEIYIIADDELHKSFLESPHILCVMMEHFSKIFKQLCSIRVVIGKLYHYAATGVITLL